MMSRVITRPKLIGITVGAAGLLLSVSSLALWASRAYAFGGSRLEGIELFVAACGILLLVLSYPQEFDHSERFVVLTYAGMALCAVTLQGLLACALLHPRRSSSIPTAHLS